MMTKPNEPSIRTWRIFAITTLGLFLELTLIRWIATEVRIFAYLQNTILVVCFLGLGMGALTCRKPSNLRPGLIRLTMLMVLLVFPPTREMLRAVSTVLSFVSGYLIWAHPDFPGLRVAVPLVALGLALTFLLMFLLFQPYASRFRYLFSYLNRVF